MGLKEIKELIESFGKKVDEDEGDRVIERTIPLWPEWIPLRDEMFEDKENAMRLAKLAMEKLERAVDHCVEELESIKRDCMPSHKRFWNRVETDLDCYKDMTVKKDNPDELIIYTK